MDVRLWLQRALTLTGIACLGWFGYVTVDAAMYQRAQAAEFERQRAAQMLPASPLATAPASEADTNLIGLLDIPRLSMSTPVVRGDDSTTLSLAAGHLPDTPRPWEPGNSAIAGHRDGLFRPLRNIRVGDDIFMRTSRGDLRYRVNNTKIVMPDDLTVLSRTDGQTLTLITCYPFQYIGAAPQRFIVRAERVENIERVENAGTSPPRSVAVEALPATPATAVEAPKPLKTSSKPSVKKRKPQKSAAKRTATPKTTPTSSLSKSSAGERRDGKARKFFRKIGGFFKKPKPRPDP